MKLNYRKIGTGSPLFILHGVFGSADNWQTVGKELAQSNAVYLIDQRNHGASGHSDIMNYDTMADDIKELIIDEGLQSVNLLGHSMGGKVAMNFACRYPDMVSKLIVVDISPKEYPPHHQQIFKGFHSVNLNDLKSRKEAELQMAEVIEDFGVRLFILKNLTRSEGKFVWKINLDSIEKNITEIGKPLSQGALFGGKTLYIGGSKSNYILKTDHELIKTHFPEASIETVEGAGHWVHAERPAELTSLVNEFLSIPNHQ